MTKEELAYALSKQVPAMRAGVTIQTQYGDLNLTGNDAVKVADLVQKLLEKQYRKASD